MGRAQPDLSLGIFGVPEQKGPEKNGKKDECKRVSGVPARAVFGICGLPSTFLKKHEKESNGKRLQNEGLNEGAFFRVF